MIRDVADIVRHLDDIFFFFDAHVYKRIQIMLIHVFWQNGAKSMSMDQDGFFVEGDDV